MLVDVFLISLLIIGLCVLFFYLICIFKQFHNNQNTDIIEIFPMDEIYKKNAYEGEFFELSNDEKDSIEKFALKQRGSVRISSGLYFTSKEYKEYKENVLKMELP